MRKWGLATCFIVVRELYSSWEIFPCPAVLVAYATRMVQFVLDVPESLKVCLLGLHWEKDVVIKNLLTFHSRGIIGQFSLLRFLFCWLGFVFFCGVVSFFGGLGFFVVSWLLGG